MGQEIHIRAAAADDAPTLLEIYAPYVTGTAITFEYEVPTPAEFQARIGRTLERYPYLVAEPCWGTPTPARSWAAPPTTGRRR